jgi:hypothetical protein
LRQPWHSESEEKGKANSGSNRQSGAMHIQTSCDIPHVIGRRNATAKHAKKYKSSQRMIYHRAGIMAIAGRSFNIKQNTPQMNTDQGTG